MPEIRDYIVRYSVDANTTPAKEALSSFSDQVAKMPSKAFNITAKVSGIEELEAMKAKVSSLNAGMQTLRGTMANKENPFNLNAKGILRTLGTYQEGLENMVRLTSRAFKAIERGSASSLDKIAKDLRKSPLTKGNNNFIAEAIKNKRAEIAGEIAKLNSDIKEFKSSGEKAKEQMKKVQAIEKDLNFLPTSKAYNQSSNEEKAAYKKRLLDERKNLLTKYKDKFSRDYIQRRMEFPWKQTASDWRDNTVKALTTKVSQYENLAGTLKQASTAVNRSIVEQKPVSEFIKGADAKAINHAINDIKNEYGINNHAEVGVNPIVNEEALQKSILTMKEKLINAGIQVPVTPIVLPEKITAFQAEMEKIHLTASVSLKPVITDEGKKNIQTLVNHTTRLQEQTQPQQEVHIKGIVDSIQAGKNAQYIHLTGILDKLNRSHKKGGVKTTIDMTGKLVRLQNGEKLNKEVALTGKISKLLFAEKLNKNIELKAQVGAAGIETLEQSLKEIPIKPIEIPIKPFLEKGKDGTKSALSQLRAKLNKLSESAKDIKVTLDTSSASTKLDQLIEKLNELRKPVTVNIQGNGANAAAENAIGKNTTAVIGGIGSKAKAANNATKEKLTPFQQGYRNAQISEQRRAGAKAYHDIKNGIAPSPLRSSGYISLGGHLSVRRGIAAMMAHSIPKNSILAQTGIYNPKGYNVQTLTAGASKVAEGIAHSERSINRVAGANLSGSVFHKMKKIMDSWTKDMNAYNGVLRKAEKLLRSGSLKRQRAGQGLANSAYPMRQALEAKRTAAVSATMSAISPSVVSTSRGYTVSHPAFNAAWTGTVPVSIPISNGKAFHYAPQKASTGSVPPPPPTPPTPLVTPVTTNEARTPKSRMRKRSRGLYQLVGNTSFGANTPMAVQMFKDMGIMAAIGGVMGAISSSLSQAVEYQNVITTAKAILKNSDKNYRTADFYSMVHSARNVGKTTKFTAPQVADAVRFMAMAGMGTKDIKESIAPIADVALIGDTDLGLTADKMTNIMTTYRKNGKSINTRKMANMLTSTFTHTNTDMLMLAESMQYAGGISNAANLPLNQLLAMLGVMGDSGIQASMAGTTMRMMLQNIIKPNKEQKAMWKALGISTRNANGTTRNIMDILGDVADKAHEKGYEGKLDQVVAKLFRVTSTAGAVAIIQNIAKVRELAAINEHSYSVSDKVSNEKKNTVSGLWARVTSAFTELNVQLFEENISSIVKVLKSLEGLFNDPRTKQSLKNILDLLVDLGHTIFVIAQTWMSFYNSCSGMFKFMLKFQLFMTQVKFLFSPFVQLSRTIAIAISWVSKLNEALMAMSGLSAVAATNSTRAAVGDAAGGVLFGLSGQASRKASILRYTAKGGKLSSVFKAGMVTYSAAGIANSVGKLGRYTLASVVSKLAGLFNLLVNPVTAAIAALAVFGLMLYKIHEREQQYEAIKKNQKPTFNYINYGVRNHKKILGYATNKITSKDILTSNGTYRKHSPLFKNTKGFKDIDAGVYTSPSYALDMWHNHIALMKNYILGGDKWKKNADIYTGISAAEIGYNPYVYQQRAHEVARRGAIAQIAISSKKAQDAIAGVKYWYNWRKQLQAKKQYGGYQEAMFNQHIDAIRNEYSNWNEASPADIHNINNTRTNKLVDTKEGKYALWKYVNEFIDNYKDFANNAIVQAANSMSQIMLTAKDMNGQVANFTLPVENGKVQWAKLFASFRLLGFSFRDSLQQRLSWAAQALLQLDKIGELSNIDIAKFLRESGIIVPGMKFSRGLWKNAVMYWYNGNYKGKGGYKNAEDFWKRGHWNNWLSMSEIFSYSLGISSKKGKGKGKGKNKGNNANSNNTNDTNTNSPKNQNNSLNVDAISNKKDKNKGYESHYNRTAARPTQIVFNITNLANFAKTDIKTMNPDNKEFAQELETKVANTVYQMFATAANTYSGIVNKNDIV